MDFEKGRQYFECNVCEDLEQPCRCSRDYDTNHPTGCIEANGVEAEWKLVAGRKTGEVR